jgi:uncharacterized membrane protein
MQENDEWITGTIVLFISLLFLAPVFFSLDRKPFTAELAVLLAITLPLEVFAYYLFLSSIRMAALSLTVPLLAFTPVLTIVSSWAILGEHITITGAFGILLVTVGAYVLNGDLANRHILAPIKAIFKHPGSRRMFLVSVIWSVTSALGKKGVILYDAIPFGVVLVTGDLVIFALMAFFRVRMGWSECCVRKNVPGLFLLAGFLMAAAEVAHFVAISLTPVAYMISVKRLSLVFGVIMGWLFFDERNISYRLMGASTMVCGVFFIYY